jgi:mRNA interferase MazF
MNEIRQEDVYWSDPADRHPCVVVQSDVFNRSRISTTVVSLITSNLSRASAPGNVALRKGDGNLPKEGVANVSQVLTVDKSELTERVGRLPANVIDVILARNQIAGRRLTPIESEMCYPRSSA